MDADRIFSRSSASFMRVGHLAETFGHRIKHIEGRGTDVPPGHIGTFTLVLSTDNTSSCSHSNVRQSKSTVICKGR